MGKTSISSRVAQATNGNVYEVQETPIFINTIRMEIDWLKLFCNDRSLPLFCLKVEETIHGGISFPVKEPYKEFFTIYQEWIFYAVEHLPAASEGPCAVEMRA